MQKMMCIVLVVLSAAPVRSQAWMASLAFFKAPQSLDKSWTPQWGQLNAYWAFENNWNDSSGKGNNGSPLGSPAYNSTSFKEGKSSASFDGNSVVSLGTVLGATYTKVAWIMPGVGADSRSNNILSAGNSGSHAFWTSGCGTLKLSGGHNNSWGAVCDPSTLTIGVWYHVAITYDSISKNMLLYKNGVLVSSASNVDNFNGSGDLELGGYGGNSNQYVGLIDEAAVWNSALSLSDIQTIYNRQLSLH